MSKEIFFEQREAEMASFVEAVENGDYSALKLYGHIKTLEKQVKEIKETIEPYALEEAERFGEKNFSSEGFKFELRNGTRRFSFKNIDSWNDKQKELKEIEDKAKHAFSSMQKGLQIATGDGEEIMLPEVNYTKDSLIVKTIK